MTNPARARTRTATEPESSALSFLLLRLPHGLRKALMNYVDKSEAKGPTINCGRLQAMV